MDWCWIWNSNTLATWCEKLTHWKRPWCWERLGAGGEGDNRGWDGWMAILTWWTWVWLDSGSWWWTGRPGMLWFMGSQRVGHDWATELNWTELSVKPMCMQSCFSHVWLFSILWTVCSPPHSSAHGILQARTLEWVATPSSRGSSQPNNQATSVMPPELAGKLKLAVVKISSNLTLF